MLEESLGTESWDLVGGSAATPMGGGGDGRAGMASLEGAGSAAFIASTALALSCSSSGTVSPAQ